MRQMHKFEIRIIEKMNVENDTSIYCSECTKYPLYYFTKGKLFIILSKICYAEGWQEFAFPSPYVI